jgi:hypothetical protein
MIGSDVNYRVEFAPTQHNHTTPFQRRPRIFLSVEQIIRGIFDCQELGKLLLSIDDNSASKKEKCVLYKFKVKVPNVVVAEH